ncbi:hypothetical protein ACLOJK_031459 [Asimina triloba]
MVGAAGGQMRKLPGSCGGWLLLLIGFLCWTRWMCPPKWTDADLLFVEMDGARCGGCCVRHQVGLAEDAGFWMEQMGMPSDLDLIVGWEDGMQMGLVGGG